MVNYKRNVIHLQFYHRKQETTQFVIRCLFYLGYIQIDIGKITHIT